MKKLIYIIIALFTTISLQAQDLEINAGYTMTGLQQSQDGIDGGSFKLLNGAHAGVQWDFAVFKTVPQLSLTAGLWAEMRAGRYDIDWREEGTTETRILYYGVIPVHLSYRKPINKNSNWIFFGGPELSVGVYGETNEHYYLGTQAQVDDKSPFGDEMNRFDVSLGVGAAYEYRHLQFKLSYDFPLTNSSKNDDPSTLRQHNFRFTMAYSFRKWK